MLEEQTVEKIIKSNEEEIQDLQRATEQRHQSLIDRFKEVTRIIKTTLRNGDTY
jgi:hypothetical protein